MKRKFIKVFLKRSAGVLAVFMAFALVRIVLEKKAPYNAVTLYGFEVKYA